MTDVLVQKLSTGDTVVFDRRTRDLYLLDASAKWDAASKNPVGDAQARVKEGHGHHFDKRLLGRVQNALKGIVLLGGLPENP